MSNILKIVKSYEYFQNININKSGLCNVDLKKYLKNLITLGASQALSRSQQEISCEYELHVPLTKQCKKLEID